MQQKHREKYLCRISKKNGIEINKELLIELEKVL